jgi:RNA polymerase sigma-70 factor, ECF subfamily
MKAMKQDLQDAAGLEPSDDLDAVLMTQTATGNLAAFEELVVRNQSSAWALALRYLGDHADAEDIVQESFLKLLRAAPRYKPTAKFKTYFSQIVVRLCLDFRSKKRPVYCATMPEHADTEKNPDLLLCKKESTIELGRAFAAIPPTQRMAILLRHLENFTYSEIAEAMNISAKAVDSLLQRGRKALRSRFYSNPK